MEKYSFNTNSITFRLVIIAVLILFMIIPVEMIKSMIKEREGNKNAEQIELNNKWGGVQKIVGPVLVVPFKKEARSNSYQYLYITPEKFNVQGNVDSEERIRGIQKVLSFQSKMSFNGRFVKPDTQDVNLNEEALIAWNKAFIVLTISNRKGVKNNVKFNVDNQPMDISFDLEDKLQEDIKYPGLKIKLPESYLLSHKELLFNFDLLLNGADGLHITPVGQQSDIKLISNWKAVSFIGDFLPSESDSVNGGLQAEWNLYNYNKSANSSWVSSRFLHDETKVGFDLLFPLNHYQKTMRAVKYALLFITLTFLVFFVIEVLGYRRIHPIQYLMVSLALVLFYSLLLAFSEHIGFNLSYVISAFATILLITAYSKSLFKNIKQTIFMFVFLVLLYVYLFIVLQQADMALLLGSVGLFIALAVVMFISRNVDWYKFGNKKLKPGDDE